MDLRTQTENMANSEEPQPPYRFNAEELRVLRQCNKDSFYQRSLPISTVLSIGTYYAVKSGYLKGHPRFGPTPKVLMAATIGYFVGKFSYQTKCMEKLMQLPNSPLGEMLRQRKRQSSPQETFADQSSHSWPETDFASGVKQMDSEPPMGEGFDTRPLDSHPFEDEAMLSVPNQSTSYEELRRRNREEQEHRKPKPYRGSTSEDLQPPPVSTPDNDYTTQARAKNKYGDVWAE